MELRSKYGGLSGSGFGLDRLMMIPNNNGDGLLIEELIIVLIIHLGVNSVSVFVERIVVLHDYKEINNNINK